MPRTITARTVMAGCALIGLVSLDVLIYTVLRLWRQRPEAGPGQGAAETLNDVVLGAGVAVALVTVTVAATVGVRGLLATWRAGRWIDEHALPPCERLSAIARRVGAGDNDVRLVQLDVDKPIAVTHGLLRPVVAISTGLTRRTADDELAAVLGHEMHHARRRHPLGRLVVETVASTLWFVPGPRVVAHHVKTRQELSADQAALAFAAPSVVASALVKCLPDSGRPGMGTGMGGDTALAARIEQLEHGSKRFARFLRCCHLRRLLLSVLVLLGLIMYCLVAAAAGDAFTPFC
ncbi:M56 family metallopeptidase [Streptomyces coerulescens]|jgi:BlaR1 peptidase M56|uniref:M56 family metallopeptidase n=1 Tax=Streptomyces coerulescens TaxID=29304 RepID=A0ABW0CS30_STRCD